MATEGDTVDFASLNRKAVLRGYLIHPDCCTKAAEAWLDGKTEDYNATFYKEWSDVLFRDRFELFLDQLRHYASTYGTDFQGYTWTPNDRTSNPDFTHLKVVKAGTDRDFVDAAMRLLSSGVALKPRTVDALCDLVAEKVKESKLEVNLDDVANREAQAQLAMRLNRFPTDAFAILRCLVYAATGKGMLIKDKITLRVIKHRVGYDAKVQDLVRSLTDDNLVSLSRIFRRFKPLFLAMKCKRTAKVINRINKLAVKNHTPLKVGFWENALSTPHTDAEIAEALTTLDNFRKVRILQAINVAFLEEKSKVYVIRNGHIYLRHNYAPDYDFEYLARLGKLVRASLVDALSKKACRVKYPADFDLAVPSSQKTFIGNFPFGTSFKMTKNNVVGIYWRNEWGTRDFDLSMTTYDGRVLSWCNDYRNGDNSVVYSGDMTNADPEATELLFVKDTCPDGVVRVNRYWGDCKHSSFRFFVANEEMPAKEKLCGYMVEPDNVKLDTRVDVDEYGEKTVGLVHDNTLTLMDLASGNGRVSRFERTAKEFIGMMANRTKTFLRLRDLLEEAGFVEDAANPDIDFTDLSTNTIIDLLAA